MLKKDKRDHFKEEYIKQLKARQKARKKVPLVPAHKCKYCGATVETPDTECYKNPLNQIKKNV